MTGVMGVTWMAEKKEKEEKEEKKEVKKFFHTDAPIKGSTRGPRGPKNIVNIPSTSYPPLPHPLTRRTSLPMKKTTALVRRRNLWTMTPWPVSFLSFINQLW